MHPEDGVDEPQVAGEMPKYRCHKEVWANKIAEVQFREATGEAVIVPAEEGFVSFVVDADYVQKHKPKAGGYYIVYEDGYKSFSPAEPFEKGYTLI